MTREHLRAAIEEAERFLVAAHNLDLYREVWRTTNDGSGTFLCQSSSVVAEVKRRSMDLTRALARMRRP